MTAAASIHPAPRLDVRWLGEVLALAALYFLTARLGLLMAIPGAYVTPVWPPSGIALAAVLLRGRRVWPGIWLGSFAANFWHFYDIPMGLATGVATPATMAIGACLAALLGRELLRRFADGRNSLERVLDVCAFMALGGVASCLVSATIGVTTLCLAGYTAWPDYGQAWLTWWLGDTGGVFIVSPLLLVWGGAHQRKLAGRWAELFGGFGLMIAVTYYVFCKNTAVLFTGKPLTFIILIPFLVWAAVRFGRRGAAGSAGLITLLALWGTIHETGPFNLGPRNEALLLLELFLGVMALTALCLAAMFTEREHLSAEQQRAVEELESHVRERTSALVQSEAQARQHLAGAERARAALLSILEDQREVEEKLRESQTRTQLLVKSSNIGLWDWNLVTNDVFFSPEWKSQLGCTGDEVPGRYEEWENRLHPEDRASSLRAVQDFREGRRADYDVEFRMRHKDGSWRSILTHADLIRDASGKPVRMMGCHIDITARKQAEEKLRESETRFRELAENIDEVFWIWTATPENPQLLYVSPAYATIWGRSCESLYGSPQSWKEALHPDDKKWVLAEIAHLDFEKVNDLSYRIVRPDQSIRWIRDRIFPVRDRAGVVVRFAGIAEDITESKKNANALERAEKQYHSIFNDAIEGIFRTSLDGKFLVANPAAARIFGFDSPEQLIAERGDIAQQGYVDPRRREEFKRVMQEQGVVNSFEYEAYRKDGSRGWICENARAVKSPSGEVLYFEGIFEDVTERKRAEKALRESEERFRTIFEQAPLGISEGEIATERFLSANQRYIDILGYSLDELRELTFRDYSHPEDLQKDLLEFQKLASGEIRTYAMEKRYLRKDGAIIWVNLTVTGLARPGEKPLTCIAVIDDITDRIKAEEALSAQALRYKTLMETSTDSIYVLDEKGDLQDANAAFLVRRGYTVPEVKGLNVADWDAQWNPERLRERLRKLRESSAVFETRHLCKDGSLFDVEVCATGVRIAEEQLFFCVTRDITERKQAERALRESEARFRRLLASNIIGVVFWTLQGDIFEANDLFLNMIGYTREDLRQGRIGWKNLTPPEYAAVDEKALAELMATGTCFPFEKEYVRKDGSRFSVLIGSALLEPHKETGSSFVMDISERKQAEDRLRRSEEKFKTLFGIAPVGISVLDRQHNVIDANPALEQITRLRREELLNGTNWDRKILNADGTPMRSHEFPSERAMAENRPVNDVEAGIVTENGETIWVQVSVAPLDLPDAGAVVITQDITERKRAAEALEAANRQLRILSRQLFHIQEEERRHLARELHDEIGQTLTAAKINLKIIAPDVPAKITGRLDDSIQLLDQLLRQVRQLSLDLRPPLLDELGLVPTLRWLVDQQAQRAGLRVTFTTNVDGLEIEPDVQTACFRVAQEAITNIIRHSGAKSVTVELRREMERLTLSVRDDGAGFDPAMIQQRTAQHSTLGLVSMKERALLVRGGFEIHSAPGQGAEIRAWFPLPNDEHPSTAETE